MLMLDVFPRRPMAAQRQRGPFGAWLAAVVLAVLIGGLAGMVALDIGPALRDDFAVSDKARPAPQVRMTEGRCRSAARSAAGPGW